MKKENIRVVKVDSYYSRPITEIIYHDVPLTRKQCGIYKLMFGDKYYIGQSIHIGKRAKVHQAEINKAMSAGANPGKRLNITLHLRNNSSINSMHVYVMELCSESDLQAAEQKWLTQSCKDKNCLNSNFTAYITPEAAAAKKFKAVITKPLTLDTQRQLTLYNNFLIDLNKIKVNPRATVKKWFN